MGVRHSSKYIYSTPVFELTADLPTLMSGPRPAVAEAELDLGDRPVVAVRQLVQEGLLGAPSWEFGRSTFIRFEGPAGPRVFEVMAYDGEESYRRYRLDPWERAGFAEMDIDEACDELSELDARDPRAPVLATDLTFRVLTGWFVAGPLSSDLEPVAESGWLADEIGARGIWQGGDPPWRTQGP